MKQKIIYCVFAILSVATGLHAHAETDNPIAGLPGFFDTSTPEEGKVTVSLPLTSMDYGFTDNWSVGSNFIAFVYPVASDKVPFYFNTRYRFYDNNGYSSAISLYTYDAFKNLKNHFYSDLLSWNNQYYFNSRNMIELSANGYIGKDRYQGASFVTEIGDAIFHGFTTYKDVYDYTSSLYSGYFGAMKYTGYIKANWAISATAGFYSASWNNDTYVKGYYLLGQYHSRALTYKNTYKAESPFYALEMEFIKYKDSRLSFGILHVPHFYSSQNTDSDASNTRTTSKSMTSPLLDYIIAY